MALGSLYLRKELSTKLSKPWRKVRSIYKRNSPHTKLTIVRDSSQKVARASAPALNNAAHCSYGTLRCRTLARLWSGPKKAAILLVCLWRVHRGNMRRGVTNLFLEAEVGIG